MLSRGRVSGPGDDHEMPKRPVVFCRSFLFEELDCAMTRIRLAGCLIVPWLLLSCLVPGSVQAQSCHALTGTWKLNLSASHMGSGLSFNPRYSVSAIELSLEPVADGIHQTWHLSGPHLDETDRYKTTTDGALKPTGLTSALNTIPVEVRGRWENCTLVQDEKTVLFGQVIWTESRFIFSADDRQLTIAQISRSDLGDVERQLVFDRTGGKDGQ